MKIPTFKSSGMVNFKALARKTGIDVKTLRQRYKRGARGKQLLERNLLFENGQVRTLSDNQKKIINQNKMTYPKVQERLDNGWSFAEAVHYKSEYVKHVNEICLQIMQKKTEILIPITSIDSIIENGVTVTGLKRMINKGVDINKIIRDDTFYYVDGVLQGGKKLDKYLQERRRLSEQARLENERRERNKRPWLYDGTPQKHQRGKYCQYLMETSIYPKAVQK